MNWLSNSFGKTFLATIERDTYSFVLVKGYLKTIHIVFLTILITLIFSSVFWTSLIFEKNSAIPGRIEIFLYSLLIISFCFFCKFYSNTDFFRRFFPLLLWGLAYWVFFFNLILGMLIPANHLTFLFDDALNKGDLEKSALALQFAVFLANWFKLFFVFLFFVINRNYWKEIVRRFRASPATFLCYLLGLILVYNWIIFSSTKTNSPESSSKNQLLLKNIYENGSMFFKFSFYFSTVLIIPFWEEIFYRYLPTEIFGCTKWTIPLFIFATLWFAIAHVHLDDLNPVVDEVSDERVDYSFTAYFQNLFQTKLLFYWYMSLIFISVYWIADFSLVYPIALHFFVNLVSFSVFS